MNSTEFEILFASALKELIKKSSTIVDRLTALKLEKIYKSEISHPIIASQLQLMVENIHYAQEHGMPACQDTGHLNFFIRLGNGFPFIRNFQPLIQDCIQLLTKEAILRPNSVDPLQGFNPGDNSGSSMPPIYLEIVDDSSELVITVFNKGGGSENMARLFMLPSTSGASDIIQAVMKTVKEAGGKPCPPIIVGIGLGGDASKSMFLAKKALLRPLGSHNPRHDVADLERTLLRRLNGLNVGVMGLGGGNTCLDVRVELAMRHPATFPLGVVVDCYSHRTASCRIKASGSVSFGHLNSNYEFVEILEDV